MKNRIVIKIGTNVLADKTGRVDYGRMEKFVNDIAKIKKQRKDILLVTSGAIGAGMAELNIIGRPRDVKIQQACAAVGQSIIMSKYKEFFNKHDINVAQILLSYDSFSNRKNFLNLRNCIQTLLKLDTIPIINENDPISIDELGASFGDNDKLSALVASKIEADTLLILTTVDGIYDKDPKFKDAKLIREVHQFNKGIENLKGKSILGTGGIKTKIEAAKITMSSGIITIIANGKKENIIDIINGKKQGTTFYPSAKLSSKKRWIRFSKPKGKIFIDKGAKKAMLNGKNLLPSGIIDIKVDFDKDDVVDIFCDNGLFAKIITDYKSKDLTNFKGKNSLEIKKAYNKRINNIAKRENLVFME
ncbi:glutamate 5-kinase [Candidatus Woesearchaeota archaeon]|nr:glutamate 5-kinase [Candidatus Woesearchaeota archaeon]|tara:strand:+ start:1538 stop:2620 length:1083 start_codon:yes stop_codon:yes gene_type:complete